MQLNLVALCWQQGCGCRQVSNLRDIPKYFCLSRAAVRREPVGAGLVYAPVSGVREKSQSRAGNLAKQLCLVDAVILDELGYLPFPASGGALLFHLISHLYEKTSLIITTNSLLMAY